MKNPTPTMVQGHGAKRYHRNARKESRPPPEPVSVVWLDEPTDDMESEVEKAFEMLIGQELGLSTTAEIDGSVD